MTWVNQILSKRHFTITIIPYLSAGDVMFVSIWCQRAGTIRCLVSESWFNLVSGVRESVQSGIRESVQYGVRESVQSGVRESVQSGVIESVQSGVREFVQSGVFATSPLFPALSSGPWWKM